jgi:hypothetical protein
MFYLFGTFKFMSKKLLCLILPKNCPELGLRKRSPHRKKKYKWCPKLGPGLPALSSKSKIFFKDGLATKTIRFYGLNREPLKEFGKKLFGAENFRWFLNPTNFC